MNVNVAAQILCPGMQHERECRRAPEMPGAGSEFGERRGDAGKEQLLDGSRAGGDQSVEGVRQRKDEVEVRDRQHFPAPGGEPRFLRPRLALRTMTVAAGNGLRSITCLMVTAPLWGPRSLKRRESWALRPWSFPLHLGLQQCDQPIWWPEFALAKVGRHHRLDSLQLLAGVGANVDLGRGQVGMSKPERNLADVLRGLQNHHCAGVPQHMWRGLLAGQGRTSLTRGEDMASKNVCHAPSTQGIAAGVDEHLRR